MNPCLLLDLDDTLLDTNLESFIPAYFQALTKHLAPRIDPGVMMRALVRGTNRMNENEDFSRTLEEVFASEFYPSLSLAGGELDAEIEDFYDNIFPTLSHLTAQRPAAKAFVEWALSRGYRIAIATDPLLPRKATSHRLRWAGFEPDQFELVSTFDHFHFSKTHPAYYAEVLGRLGWPDGPVVMVGNDMERDILPAKKLGIPTFHIDNGSPPLSENVADAHGDLAFLRSWLDNIEPARLIPAFKSIDSVVGILYSSPAVFQGLTRSLESSEWHLGWKPEEWTMVELICHIRDTEIEIHHVQLKLLTERDEPFIPRPDTSVWASQRDYLHEEGRSALEQFMRARKETLRLLNTFSAADWKRSARHAIFGPTNFLEVAGFMADHDRLHIQQAWRILRKGK